MYICWLGMYPAGTSWSNVIYVEITLFKCRLTMNCPLGKVFILFCKIFPSETIIFLKIKKYLFAKLVPRASCLFDHRNMKNIKKARSPGNEVHYLRFGKNIIYISKYMNLKFNLMKIIKYLVNYCLLAKLS